MRIVVLASLARSLVLFRGQLLSDMVKAGHQVLAVAPEEDERVKSALATMGVAYRSVPMDRVALHPLADLRTIGALLRLLGQERPDVFLAYTMKPIIYGGMAARLAGIPSRYAMITGLGYMYSGHVPSTLKRRLLQQASDGLYRLALRGLKALFVYNPDDEQELASRGLLRGVGKVVRVAGSGVDLGHFAPSALPSGRPSFLMTARLLREKGVEEFVQAARILKARHPEVRIRLLGPFYSHPTSISKEQVEGWVKEGMIEYMGRTDDVRPYLADCTVFVLPSYYREGIPRTILEAMAMGRAIITTDSPGCRETVIPGLNGLLVPPRDAAALADAMERFLLDPDLASRMGERSREIAVERFDVRRVNRVLLENMELVSGEPMAVAS